MEVWLDDYLSDYGSTLADSGLEFDGVKLDCAAFQQYRNDSAGLAHLIAEARRFGTFVLRKGLRVRRRQSGIAGGADLAQGFYWPEKNPCGAGPVGSNPPETNAQCHITVIAKCRPPIVTI